LASERADSGVSCIEGSRSDEYLQQLFERICEASIQDDCPNSLAVDLTVEERKMRYELVHAKTIVLTWQGAEAVRKIGIIRAYHDLKWRSDASVASMCAARLLAAAGGEESEVRAIAEGIWREDPEAGQVGAEINQAIASGVFLGRYGKSHFCGG